MFKSFFKSVLALSACLYLGGSHLAILQVLAWTGMLVTYNADDGLATGLKDTFSGEKPCPMCKAIKSVQKAETDAPKGVSGPGANTLEKLAKEMMASQTTSGILLVPTPAKKPEFPSDWTLSTRRDQPPVPPPRLLV